MHWIDRRPRLLVPFLGLSLLAASACAADPSATTGEDSPDALSSGTSALTAAEDCPAGSTPTTPGSGLPEAWRCSGDASRRIELPLGTASLSSEQPTHVIKPAGDGGYIIATLAVPYARSAGVTKVDANGNVVWQVQLPQLTGIDVNAQGQIAAAQIVATERPNIFGPHPSRARARTTVTLLGADGSVAWTRSYTPGGRYDSGDFVAYVTIDASGEVTLAGTYHGELAVGDEVLSAGPPLDCGPVGCDDAVAFYLIRHDASGAVAWARSYGDAADNQEPYRSRRVYGVTAGSAGGVVLYGRYSGKLVVDAEVTDPGAGYHNVYLEVDDAGHAATTAVPEPVGVSPYPTREARFDAVSAPDGAVYLHDGFWGSHTILRHGTTDTSVQLGWFTEGARQLVARADGSIAAIFWGSLYPTGHRISSFVAHYAPDATGALIFQGMHELAGSELPLAVTADAGGALVVLVADTSYEQQRPDGSYGLRLVRFD